jgi:hypothetical protein
MERENTGQQESAPGPSIGVPEPGTDVELSLEGTVTERIHDEVGTPERQVVNVALGGPDPSLKPNGDPLTPGLTPASGPLPELE